MKELEAETAALRERAERAERDAVTDVLVRAVWEQRVGEADSERPGAVVVVDVNSLKLVNNRYGHAAGDAALRETARRMVTTLPLGSIVGRLGGDELAAWVPVAFSLSKLRRALWNPVDIGGGLTTHYGAACGLAIPDGSITLAERIDLADAEMYADKARSYAKVSAVGRVEVPLDGRARAVMHS